MKTYVKTYLCMYIKVVVVVDGANSQPHDERKERRRGGEGAQDILSGNELARFHRLLFLLRVMHSRAVITTRSERHCVWRFGGEETTEQGSKMGRRGR